MVKKNATIGQGLVLGLCLCVLLTVSSDFSLGQNSLLMPRAVDSLLLDVVRAGDRLVVVGERGHILYSIDAGASWTQASVPTRQMLTGVVFPSPLRGWAVGHDGLILASVDGGEHWVLQRDGLVEQARLNEQAIVDLQALKRELTLEVETSDDAEVREFLLLELEELDLDIEDAEFLLEEAVNAPPLLDVFFEDELSGVAVGAFNTMLYTEDGGVTWLLGSALLDNPDEYHLNGITGNGLGDIWIAGEGGVLFHRDSSGEWRSLKSPYRGTLFGIAALSKTQDLLAFGLRGNAFRSSDGGQSWQKVPLGNERTLAGGLFINEDYAVMVGSVGAVWVSDDGGYRFRDMTLENRRNLSGVSCNGEGAVVVGQGGVQIVDCFGSDHGR